MTRLLIALLFLAPVAAHADDKNDSPWSMADEYFDSDEMAKSREALVKEHGGAVVHYIEAERLEFRSGDHDEFLWDAQSWIGGDKNKVWIKTEGEYAIDDEVFEEVEIQALWSRAVTRYFDVQAGLRHDILPGDDRTYGVMGIHGLAPYRFEIDAAGFVSDDGDVSARVEVEYEFMLSQRVILQPRTEVTFQFQDVPDYELGSGLSSVDLGARLKYRVTRQVAPFVGVEWARSLGATADFARSAGDNPSDVSFIAGISLWF